MQTKPISIFDSGVGGLSVAFEVTKILPNEQLIYIADTLRQPYGEKTKEEVAQYANEIVDHLNFTGVKAVIVACSTATAVALSSLQKKHPAMLIIGLLNDTFVNHAIVGTKANKVGIIATRLTTKSQTFSKAIKEKAPHIKTFSHACPKLVDLISLGNVSSNEFTLQIKNDVNELLKQGIDSLVLGCTHFTLLKDLFEKLFPELHVISPPFWTAQHLKEKLIKNDLLNPDKSAKNSCFFSTDSPSEFKDTIYKVTRKNISIEKISLLNSIEKKYRLSA